MIRELLHLGGHRQTSSIKEKQTITQVEEKNTGINDQVVFSQEELQKTSGDIALLKKELQATADDASKTKKITEFVKTHGELMFLGGGVLGGLIAQGVNHTEVMKKFDELQTKLDAKNLGKLASNFKSEQIKEYLAEKSIDIDKEVVQKLKSLEGSNRLSKATPIRGFLTDVARLTLYGLCSVGTIVGAGAVALALKAPAEGIVVSLVVGGIADAFLNMTISDMGPMEESVYTKIGRIRGNYHQPIGSADAVRRLDKHRTVEIRKSNTYDKINDINQLPLV